MYIKSLHIQMDYSEAHYIKGIYIYIYIYMYIYIYINIYIYI